MVIMKKNTNRIHKQKHISKVLSAVSVRTNQRSIKHQIGNSGKRKYNSKTNRGDLDSALKKAKVSSFEPKNSQTKKEGGLYGKELENAHKKKRKSYYNLEKELISLWEKMRRHNLGKDDRSKLVGEALNKMKGRINEIAGSHVSSRVVQSCVKYCSQTERDAIFEELKPHFHTLSRNSYAVYLVKKMLDNASKKQLEGFISSLHGHVGSFLRHMAGSAVIEHAYQLGNATQKLRLLLELCSAEFQLFRDLLSFKECRLLDLIPKLGLQKGSVLLHMDRVIQPILEKGIVDHSILHRLLLEYFSIADESSVLDVITQLSGPLLVRMMHTRDGSRIAIICLKYGGAKERKKIIKGMKDHIGNIALQQHGSMVLVCALSVVDDTCLLTKIVVGEILNIMKELVLDKNGRRVILQLLRPNCSRYLSPDDLDSLHSFIPSFSGKDDKGIVTMMDESGGETDHEMEEKCVEINMETGENAKLVVGGKKNSTLRRKELLLGGLGKALIQTCIENNVEFLQSNMGKDVIYEVATGGGDGVLHPSLTEEIKELHESIASAASMAKSGETAGEHLLENFHSTRTLRKLVLDSPPFASSLWTKAFMGNSAAWSQGHRKVVSSFLESRDAGIRHLTEPELCPLVEAGKLDRPGPGLMPVTSQPRLMEE